MKRLLAGFLAGCAFAGGAAQAQATAADIQAQLKGKSVYLRGGWGENKLKFDSSGQPDKKYTIVSFTESGFKIKSVQLSGDALRLEGERFALRFDAKGEMSTFSRSPLSIEINVAPGADLQPVIDKIFATDLASLVPEMPSFWQPYAQQHFLPHDAAKTDGKLEPEIADATAGAEKPRAGDGLKRPKILFAPSPQFSDTGRAAKFTGNVRVTFIVDQQGRTTHLQVIQPAGLGLDEKAIEAVSQYKFSPGLKDGKPVKVLMLIDVHFEIV